jgi:hypothetical protein
VSWLGTPFSSLRNPRRTRSFAFANRPMSTEPCPPHKAAHIAIAKISRKSCRAALPLRGSSKPSQHSIKRSKTSPAPRISRDPVESTSINITKSAQGGQRIPSAIPLLGLAVPLLRLVSFANLSCRLEATRKRTRIPPRFRDRSGAETSACQSPQSNLAPPPKSLPPAVL